MKIGKWARLLLLAAPVLAGCKGFWDAPATGTTGGSTTLTSGIFYVLNQSTAQIAAYSVVTGTLTAVTGSPYTLPAAPYSIAVAPNGAFLYVGTAQGIYLYTIGTGGTLTLANSSANVFGDNTPYALTMDTTSSWLLDASTGGGLGGVLYAIPVSSTTGLPTASATSAVPQLALNSITAPQGITVSADNKYILVALGSNGSAIVPFTSTNQTTPMPSAIAKSEVIGVKGSGGASVSVAFDPQLRLFYVGEVAATTGTYTGGLRAFNYSSLATIGTTAPTELTGSPYSSGGLAPYSILPTPYTTGTNAGAYIYVANRTVTAGNTTGNISGFALTTTGTSTYSLTALSTTATTGALPTSLAQDSTGAFIFVADSGAGTAAGNPDLEGYNFDSTTASKLDSVISSTTGTDPVGAIAVVALP
jgi:hypothetical protein